MGRASRRSQPSAGFSESRRMLGYSALTSPVDSAACTAGSPAGKPAFQRAFVSRGSETEKASEMPPGLAAVQATHY